MNGLKHTAMFIDELEPAEPVTLNLVKLASELRLNIRVTGRRRFALRCWLAARFAHMAGWVMGGGTVFEFDFTDSEEAKAAARLRDAAPDLLAALKAVWGIDDSHVGVLFSERHAMALAAIAKAEGRS